MLVTYEHSFFNSDHSLQRVVSFDSRAKSASCNVYRGGKLDQEQQSDLSIPSDTYAGAAQIISIQSQLRGGMHNIRFHSFNCASNPTIIPASAVLENDLSRWSMYPADLTKVKIEADFRWLDTFVSPFLPKMYAWFDSGDNWKFVGGLIDRYYKGPRILMVRVRSRT